jgi:hypothetical protein
LPAAVLAAGMWDNQKQDPEILYILPGYMGLVPAVLLFGFLIEATVRTRKVKAAPSSTLEA